MTNDPMSWLNKTGLMSSVSKSDENKVKVRSHTRAKPSVNASGDNIADNPMGKIATVVVAHKGSQTSHKGAEHGNDTMNPSNAKRPKGESPPVKEKTLSASTGPKSGDASSGRPMVTRKAGNENIEGNESAKYEKMEKKSLTSLKGGGTEKELRAGHNEKKSMKLGGGGRFAAIEKKAKASGAKNPAAVAAAAGMAKYGKSKMSKMAQAGKKRAGY